MAVVCKRWRYDDVDGTNWDLVRWCVAAEAVIADSGSATMLGFGSNSVSIIGSGEPGGGTWDSPRVCPICPRIYSNNSNLRRHVRSAHPTASDLLEITSLQRKPVGPQVKLLSFDSQVQRPPYTQSALNFDDYGDPIPQNHQVHSNTVGCAKVEIQSSDIGSYSYEPT